MVQPLVPVLRHVHPDRLESYNRKWRSIMPQISATMREYARIYFV